MTTSDDIARCCDDCGADLVAGEPHRPGCALADDDCADRPGAER